MPAPSARHDGAVALLAAEHECLTTGFRSLVARKTGLAFARIPRLRPDLFRVSHAVTTEELHQMVRELLAGVEWRVLEPLLARAGESVDRETLAGEAGYQSTASTGFPRALSRLSSLGLVEYPSPGFVRATDILFPVES